MTGDPNMTGTGWDAERAHAAEAWSPCCSARLDGGTALRPRTCPLCGVVVPQGEEVRWL